MGGDSSREIIGQVEGAAKAALRIELLGGFRVWVRGRLLPDDSWHRRKAASLLKLLALAPDHCLHREQLLELLWPQLGPQAAANNFHRTLHLLRHVLEPQGRTASYLRLQGEQLLLASPESLWLDVRAFEQAALAARHCQDPLLFEHALALYGGDLLPEDRYEDWASGRREQLRGRELELLMGLAELFETQGKQERAIESWERVVEREPAEEEGQVRLMRLLALSNQRHRALQQYQHLRETLRRELDVEPEEASQRLYREILSGHFPPRTAPLSQSGLLDLEEGVPRQPVRPVPDETRAGNLPSQVSSFIGREEEVEELTGLLGITRLLTLTGAGGCGKTRLAMEVGAHHQQETGDAVWLVDLAGLSDPALVPQSVAAALKLREEPGRAIQELLICSLGPRSLLLLLDNCEHLLAACAQLAGALLAACPHLRILATSRQSLRIGGEIAWRVPSLGVPPAGSWLAPTELEGYDAVRLFAARARASRPTFRLDGETVGAAVQVCRRLDGMPLAIELAAGRLNVLSVEQLATRLDDCFALLRGGSRTALPRQQTLEAAIDWSHALLPARERALFRRLAVFVGGWTLEAAEAVGAGEGIKESEVLELLSELVDQSLVAPEEVGGAMRYRLLEPVRQYAARQLQAAGEEEEVRKRHARWYLALAERAEPELMGAEQEVWLEWLEREHDNLRAALSWTIGHGESEPALRFAGALWRFWFGCGYLQEGYVWLTRALSQPPASDSLGARSKALNGAGVFAYWQSGAERAREHYGEALQLGRGIGDMHAVATSLANLGMVAHYEGDYDQAAAQFEEALDLGRRLGDTRLVAISLNNLGTLVKDRGDPERATRLIEDSLTLFREIGDQRNAAGLLSSLGELAAAQGDHARAERLCAESISLLRTLEDKLSLTQALQVLAGAVERRGDGPQAMSLLEEALALSRDLGDKWGTALALDGLGRLARAGGDNARSVTLCEESARLHRELGYKQGVASSLSTLAWIARDRADPGRAVELYKESLALYREVGDRQGTERCLQQLAEIVIR